MKLKYLLSAFAVTAMSTFANDEIAVAANDTDNEASDAIVINTPSDEEFGLSNLSNNETFMAGHPADGHRLEEWSGSQKPTAKFGGYIIGKYAWEDKEGSVNNGDGFSLRLVRLYVDGYLFRDFKYRVQIEANGGDPTASKSPHIKDATLEWVHWKEFSIKAGQFKRAFTFEDPYNPFDVGVGDYAQLTKKLSGFSDRIGGEATNNGGRDLGIQIQGDVLPIGKDKHPLIHYQVAAYNGQGINVPDANKRKDFMGTIQFRPIKDLYIGAFGWLGNFTKDGITTDRNRFNLGVKYESDWTVRAEYARSWGYKLSEYEYNDTMSRYEVKKSAADLGKEADAFYATVGVPCTKWLKAYVKYDLYRDYASWDNTNTIYSAALNFKFNKNLYFQAQYNFVDGVKKVNDKKDHTNYNQLWALMYVRF